MLVLVEMYDGDVFVLGNKLICILNDELTFSLS